MDNQRAINMYLYLRSKTTCEREIDMFLHAVRNLYGISLFGYNRKWLKLHRNQNKNDINVYNRGGSRTLNQTRQLGGN